MRRVLIAVLVMSAFLVFGALASAQEAPSDEFPVYEEQDPEENPEESGEESIDEFTEEATEEDLDSGEPSGMTEEQFETLIQHIDTWFFGLIQMIMASIGVVVGVQLGRGII